MRVYAHQMRRGQGDRDRLRQLVGGTGHLTSDGSPTFPASRTASRGA
jgi:hypothetical protein